MTGIVEVERLTKDYGTARRGATLTRAVDDVSFSVSAGQCFGVVGESGSGKTTLAKMLLGLVRPTSGTVRLLRDKSKGLRGVGALIEGPAFYPYLSGRDNLRVLASHAGVSRARAGEVLETVGLTERARDRYSTYSLGMKQRLGLAAALLKRPGLLILDEPTNGLDPAGMADMRVTLRRLAAEGCTVLLSSHLLGEVQQTCDRVGVIARGRMVAELPVADLGAGRTLRIVAEPAERARRHLAAVVGADRVWADGAALNVEAQPDQAARINAELVRAGVAVSELRWQEPDLEQTFLELTGGNSHVE
jgi:ABC-2 type transport system ATP-binding protein